MSENTTHMDRTTLLSLIAIGFTDKQAKTYLALLELGEAPAGKIAERSGVNRTVTYENVKDLIRLGYVTESEKTNVKRYQAADPQKIFQSARANVENFKFMLPLLKALHHQGDKPRIEFYEGKEAVVGIYQTFDTASSRRFMSSFSRMEQLFSHELKRWQERTVHIKAPSPTKYLLAEDEIARNFAQSIQQRSNQEARFFSKDSGFSMDFAIVDDVLAITSFDPIYIVVLYSKELAKSASTLFDLAWKTAKK